MNDTIPYGLSQKQLWFDGKLIKVADARISVLSHALHYASSVFEGLRAYEHRIFRLDAHIERFYRSAHLIDFEIPYEMETIKQACIEVVSELGAKDAYIRPIAWRGSESLGLFASDNKVHVAIAAWQWPNKNKMAGMRLDISDWRRPDPRSAPYQSKASGLYTICTIAKQIAVRKGYDDALMLDYRGLVAEATGANIFFVSNNELHTPTPDCFLDGITRREVIELAKERNIAVHSGAIKHESIEDFSGCFMTGTAAEITLVRQIGPFVFNDDALISSLGDAYDELVRLG